MFGKNGVFLAHSVAKCCIDRRLGTHIVTVYVVEAYRHIFLRTVGGVFFVVTERQVERGVRHTRVVVEFLADLVALDGVLQTFVGVVVQRRNVIAVGIDAVFEYVVVDVVCNFFRLFVVDVGVGDVSGIRQEKFALVIVGVCEVVKVARLLEIFYRQVQKFGRLRFVVAGVDFFGK